MIDYYDHLSDSSKIEIEIWMAYIFMLTLLLIIGITLAIKG